jgi:hypothetical protein
VTSVTTKREQPSASSRASVSPRSPLARPSAGGEPGSPHVEPDRDLLAAGGDDVPDPVRPFQRGGADVDAGAAGGQRGGERGVVADAAGQLDRDVEAADHAGDQFRVGAAAERGIQIDQVDPLRPGRLPGQRRLQRVAVAGLAAGRALDQPDRLAAGHVDRRQQGQRHRNIPSQLDSSAAPASPDFSG